jgi:hypothetical protein
MVLPCIHHLHQSWKLNNPKQQALWTAPQKPTQWYRYINDTFTIWPHGRQAFGSFRDISTASIQIPGSQGKQERRACCHSSFMWYWGSLRAHWGSLQETHMHTNLDLHASSQYHPLQKNAVPSPLVWHAKTIWNTESLHEEILHLKRNTGQRARAQLTSTGSRIFEQSHFHSRSQSTEVATITYKQTICSRISKILMRSNIRTADISTKMNAHFVRTVKDDLGIYCIPCDKNTLDTGHTTEVRCNEYVQHIHLH